MTTRDVQEVLSRSVGSFVDPEGAFQKKLEAKIRGEYEKDIVIKFGVDPTKPDIHLGHAVVFRKLRQFQDMGAKVIFLIGDITAQIGDPTGKSKVRPEVNVAEITTNVKTYIDQVGKILKTDEAVFSWIANSDWFVDISDIIPSPNATPSITIKHDGKEDIIQLNANDFIGKAAVFENTRLQKTMLHKTAIHSISLLRLLSVLRRLTFARLIQRDLFQERIKSGEELYLHELMYPVLQGIDSGVIAQIYGSCDLEIGGTDQTFNMLMGRDVMNMFDIPAQSVMSMEILPGTDGKEKMSKSLDNYIAITDKASDMYGKVMSIPDSAMATYFKLATYTPLSEVENIEKELKEGRGNPRDVKMRLAKQIVAEYHGEEAASAAEADFIETFSKGGLPTDIPVIKTAEGAKLVDILLSEPGLIESKSEWRRLVEEGAVSDAETGEKISSPDATLTKSITLKIGKRRFVKVETL